MGTIEHHAQGGRLWGWKQVDVDEAQSSHDAAERDVEAEIKRSNPPSMLIIAAGGVIVAIVGGVTFVATT